MLLAFTPLPAQSQRVQLQFMGLRIERHERKPLVQAGKPFLRPLGQKNGLMRQHGRVTGPQPPPLCGQPAVKERAAANLQPFQKVAREHGRKRAQTLRAGLAYTRLHGGPDVDDVHTAVGQVQAHGVLHGLDPAAPGLVQQAPRLAQAPAKFAARIVRNVPQQFAQVRAHHGVRGQRQVRDQRPQLARRRQRKRSAAPADAHRPQHVHVDARAGRIHA